MSFVIAFGKWGGFYFHRGWTTRLCLGWVSMTYIPEDYDVTMRRILYSGPSASSVEQYGISANPTVWGDRGGTSN